MTIQRSVGGISLVSETIYPKIRRPSRMCLAFQLKNAKFDDLSLTTVKVRQNCFHK